MQIEQLRVHIYERSTQTRVGSYIMDTRGFKYVVLRKIKTGMILLQDEKAELIHYSRMYKAFYILKF